MKKIITVFALAAGVMTAQAQVTRVSLFEEFTGENCPPCAATNPNLDALMLNVSNASKIYMIKWQVPIPSAPSNTWSLYQTNKAEIEWRYKSSTSGGYGYQSQNTPTSSITNGINSAPQGRIDGQHQWTFGAASDHPYYMSAAVINSAQAQSTPFSITLTPTWNSNFTQATVDVAISAASAFTAVGTLMFRLCLVEREINFTTAPGTNGEKVFHDVVRKSYPTVTSGTAVTNMGTSIPSTFAASQVHTLSIVCPIPSYINDLSQMAFVGFIQDDGNKKIWQAARTSQPAIPNDIKFESISLNNVICGSSFTPTLNVKNLGTNPITSLTITPYIDGNAQPVFTTAVNIAGGSTMAISMPSFTSTGGSHNFSVNITGVSGGDLNTNNNWGKTPFALVTNYFLAPLSEPFANSVPFPPANWILTNNDGGADTWSWHSAGFNGAGSARYYFYSNSVIGDVDELYLQPSNLTGMNNPMISFDYAYTYYTPAPNNENDKLEVKVSTDCGATWTTIDMMSGNSMTTAPSTTANFVPTSNQWKNKVVALPGSAANNPSVLVKFVTTNDYGNNLYIDNVNLANNITGVKNINKENTVQMFPNPARDLTNITIQSSENGNASVTVKNLLGQEVYAVSKNIQTGFNLIEIPVRNLPAGVYMVQINVNGLQSTKRLNVVH